MFVIIEGIDGSGKSTLVKELTKKGAILLKGENQHSTNSIEEFINIISQSNIQNTIYVCDRSFISDVIYRYLDDKKPGSYTLDTFYNICKNCSAIIYCNSKNAYVNSRIRGEDNITDINVSNKLREIYNFVIHVFKRYNLCKVIEYNYDIHNVNYVMEKLNEQ